MLEEVGKINTIKTADSSSIGPRCQKMLKWIENNHQKIENCESGNISFNFTGRTLKVKEENYENIV